MNGPFFKTLVYVSLKDFVENKKNQWAQTTQLSSGISDTI